MTKLEKEIKETIENVDIVDIIQKYIPLEKQGKNYFGICPFHQDGKSALSVSQEKQIYKCFGCGATGNVINFIMGYEKVTFEETLEILKNRK